MRIRCFIYLVNVEAAHSGKEKIRCGGAVRHVCHAVFEVRRQQLIVGGLNALKVSEVPHDPLP